MQYIAVFHPAEEKQGGYVVTFPDLPGCVTQGESFAQAFAMAQEALQGFLDALRQDGDTIPEPSDLQTAKAKAEENGEGLHPAAILRAVPAPPKA